MLIAADDTCGNFKFCDENILRAVSLLRSKKISVINQFVNNQRRF